MFNGKILPVFIVIGFFLSSFSANAQPVLTQQSNGLKPGNYLYSSTNGIIKVPAIGKNITWDYSHVKPDSIYTYTDTGETFFSLDTITISFIAPPTNNPHLTSLFPQANIFEAEKTIDYLGHSAGHFYGAYKTSASGLQYFGELNEDSTFKATDTTIISPAENLIGYPFTYGSLQTSSYKEYDYFHPYYDTIYTTDSTRGVAYGTLKLPGKTYTNVLVTLLTERYNDGSGTDYEYDYWAPGYGLPVLFVSFDSTGAVTDAEYTTTNVTLPLNLLSFTGQMQHGQALLNWQTTDEINTQNFSIERSANSTNFNALSSVAAADAPGINNYNYTDATPLNGDNFYRLKMFDKDGAFTYSNIIKLNSNDIQFAMNVYPNPASSATTLSFNTPLQGKYSVIIADITGKTVNRIEGTAAVGANTLQLNTSSLVAGVYLVTYIDAQARHDIKLEKK